MRHVRLFLALLSPLVAAACGRVLVAQENVDDGGVSDGGGTSGSSGADGSSASSSSGAAAPSSSSGSGGSAGSSGGGDSGLQFYGSNGRGDSGDAGNASFADDAIGQLGPDASFPVKNWVTGLTASYCDWAVRCGTFPDTATCDAYMGAQYAQVNFDVPSAAVKAVSDGKAQFDSTQAKMCLTALFNLDCAVDFLTAPPPAPCAAAFAGSVPDGGACIDDVECPGGSMCIVTSTTTCEGSCRPASGGPCRMNSDCPPHQFCAAVPIQGAGLWGSGVCEAIVPPGGNGEDCGMPVQCASGLCCTGGPAPAVCLACGSASTGATCSKFAGPACASGLACVESDDALTATCMPPAKLGEACTSLFQCGVQYTSSDIICDESGTHTCVHRPSTGPCIVVNRTNTCDPATSYCEATSGTCKPWLPQGTPCVFPSSGIDPCEPWTGCSGPVCTPLLGACTPN